MQIEQPDIRSLAIIGDKGSCALIDKQGTVVWYCPWRFEQPSLFSLLIDEKGGHWVINADGKTFKSRRYKENSAVLETCFESTAGNFTVVDFMPRGAAASGICRLLPASPVDVTFTLLLTPDYNRTTPRLAQVNSTTVSCKSFEFYIRSSHPLTVKNAAVSMRVPSGKKGWIMLLNEEDRMALVNDEFIDNALHATLLDWQNIMGALPYKGAYQAQMEQSFKAIQLMTYEYCGGIIAAATTSLPEVAHGDRNYDYRYVWLRDTAMVVSALIRADTKNFQAQQFLQFLHRGRTTNKKTRFVPLYDLDCKTAPDEILLPFTGYKGATPIRIGNNAFEQLQLDAQGNVLLAAKQIYQQKKGKPNWNTVRYIANYLVKNWKRKDHGIWEEQTQEHFTSSKVIAAMGLEFIAEYADNEKQKQRWLGAASDIRQFIKENCLTKDGAYAVYAGSDDIDVTAALYPVWLFDAPDSCTMLQTIKRIENEYREGELYHRRLELFDSFKEGVFLAASLWMAQYYVLSNNLPKAKTIIEAVLTFSTDLGFIAEEGNVKTGEMLGNFPQTFVHASLMGVILDYNNALLK